MPLWTIFHPAEAFTTPESKRDFAESITAIYATTLPPFYINVIFMRVEPDSLYIGAVARPSPHVQANEPGSRSDRPFIRITVEHIARTLPNEEYRDWMLGNLDAAMKPHIQDKGYDWEYSIHETRRDMWKVNGHVPPMPLTEAELEWVRLNEPVPYEPEKGGLIGGSAPWEGLSRRAKL
ncbi:putative oxalocrotonate tautomerase [Paraphoma chrysanthemicola]|uniref:Oxalocrotonate tautomerase n=1 Tax=Paraphoma chrysanthemicola TaxID=798071 RepID=A0A8K0VYC8_9PLEO|nr:putative oxalocrotonate tautomerase [Paraphoma chrysanthemicola]